MIALVPRCDPADHRYAYLATDNYTLEVVRVIGWYDTPREAADEAKHDYPNSPLLDEYGHEIDMEDLP